MILSAHPSSSLLILLWAGKSSSTIFCPTSWQKVSAPTTARYAPLVGHLTPSSENKGKHRPRNTSSYCQNFRCGLGKKKSQNE
mmetsp:Transcript_12398/g.17037  ORF Transcript_12398/g.17037 Transcript_12398/m.17037 type:complete len:83 (+) Transcript_12398:101-349(+)